MFLFECLDNGHIQNKEEQCTTVIHCSVKKVWLSNWKIVRDSLSLYKGIKKSEWGSEIFLWHCLFNCRAVSSAWRYKSISSYYSNLWKPETR